MILLHGFPDFWYTWRKQIPELAKSYHVIAPDQRGYGYTDKPSYVGDYNITYLTNDILDLMHFLGKEKVHLVGHDWGALVAWSAALLHQDKFFSVTGVSVPYTAPFAHVETFAHIFGEDFYQIKFQECGIPEKSFRHIPELFRASFMSPKREKADPTPLTSATFAQAYHAVKNHPEYFRPSDWFTEEDLAEYIKVFRKSGMVGPLNYYRNMNLNYAYLNLYAATHSYDINIPSLTISGTRDLPFLQLEQHVRNKFLKKPSNAFVDGGHFMQQEDAPGVTKALLEFLASVDASEKKTDL